jgi:aryl-alcohol dehydrogenase-like predicted oxidoreductase
VKITKVGRYNGHDGVGFDYSPETVRKSVLSSLSRLGTDHLDVVYLHDVEFVATPVKSGSTAGNPLDAIENSEEWGLSQADAGKIFGEGDQRILDAIRELWKLKREGMIKAVGISGMSHRGVFELYFDIYA